MTDITSTAYRDGLYAYLKGHEGVVPRFYIDTGGNLTGGAGIMMYKRTAPSGNAVDLTKQLSGTALNTANNILDAYQRVGWIRAAIHLSI